MGKTQHLQKSENVDLAYIEACCDTYDNLGDEFLLDITSLRPKY